MSAETEPTAGNAEDAAATPIACDDETAAIIGHGNPDLDKILREAGSLCAQTAIVGGHIIPDDPFRCTTASGCWAQKTFGDIEPDTAETME